MADDAKSKARQKREEAQAAALAARKRNRNLQILGGVLFAAIAVVLVVVVIGGSGGSGNDPGAVEEGDVNGVTETAQLLDGLPQDGFTLGEADAPVTIYELLDLQCPFCRIAQLDEHPSIYNGVVKSGEAKFTMVPLGFLGPDSADARAVLGQMATKDRAFQFANLFFWNQGDENSGYVTDEFLTQLVTAAGGTDADVVRDPTGDVQKMLDDADALQEDLFPQPSTPTYFVGATGADPSTYAKVEPSDNTAEDIIKAVKAVETTGKAESSTGSGGQSTGATPTPGT